MIKNKVNSNIKYQNYNYLYKNYNYKDRKIMNYHKI